MSCFCQESVSISPNDHPCAINLDRGVASMVYIFYSCDSKFRELRSRITKPKGCEDAGRYRAEWPGRHG